MKSKNLIILFWILLPLSLTYDVYKQNALLFFDPITEKKCDESNYWTPFDQSSTCYRFVVVQNDTSSSDSIKIMLDHNIALSTFPEYQTVLKKSTTLWKRYTGTVDIIDEATIYKLMKYESKPTASTSSAPPYRIGHYFMNSKYIINGKETNEIGYWTKTTVSGKVYAIDNNGNNVVYETTKKIGIRPVITLKKSLLTRDKPLIDITSFLVKGDNCQVYKYKHETKTYSNLVYKQLQGFTVTNDKLVYISSNNENREKSVMYSYLTEDNKSYKVSYESIGHGNGMTYNSKTNKILVVGPDEYKKIYQYDATTLTKEKEFSTPTYPKFNGIAYDYNNDLYIGYNGKRLFMADTNKMVKKFEWDMPMYETAQDLEYFMGYLFFISSELGAPNKYQSYSFYTKGDNFISVYDVKLDANGNPTKNFGRLICKLTMKGKGELEDIAFRNFNVYLGFATHKIDSTYSYTFYKMNYLTFINKFLLNKILS